MVTFNIEWKNGRTTYLYNYFEGGLVGYGGQFYLQTCEFTEKSRQPTMEIGFDEKWSARFAGVCTTQGGLCTGECTPLYGLNSGHNTNELQRLAALVQTVSVNGFNWVYRLFVGIGNGRAVYSRTEDNSQLGTTIEGRLLWWFLEYVEVIGFNFLLCLNSCFCGECVKC